MLDHARLKKYEQLIALTQDQLNLLNDSRWSIESFDLFQASWEEIQQELSIPDQLKKEQREAEAALCQELQSLHRHLILILQLEQKHIGNEAAHVKQNQTVVQAYYGLGRVDQTAYYMDQKK